jgi:hypothetical protein
MNCHICNTNNSLRSCKHNNIVDLKKGDTILIKRVIKTPFEKEVIEREVRGTEKSMVWCDDNLEYPIEQVLSKLTQ